ncbi:DeoR/GlpR transcriptional regulator [Bacillus sp. HMF5848]|uniref:DeoR/GlpR family DNA-binding transcription regulator n=1 Tax=Bacillus sp. HMF5848 TaxID=2495421 RepID=UPI000F797347|nr:DeoR/GlpR family DNA-binding transcription regulator [Bacillus sp. HMF5848]RSK26787.1 DeoR/GlpR transcriptional regulator [Bacillus sp. HMF5848]
MFIEERKTKIVEYVTKQNRASVQELCDVLEVSESTVRRDLKELEEAGLIRRTHGGAIPAEGVNFEPSYIEKEDQFTLEKIAIAKQAAKLIKPGDIILLDSGTTTYHMANELKGLSDITVVTNSLVIGEKLQSYRNIEVIILGGHLRPVSLALVGPLTDEALSSIYVDKAFIAANSIDIEAGVTTPNLQEATTKKNMIRSAKQNILLADSSKFGKTTFSRFAAISDVDVCITDENIQVEIKDNLEKVGVDVIVVPTLKE